MATKNHNQNEVPENFRKQLALAVRSIQWSYAIFWSTSYTQPGVLEWADGYYNGDIKTRKTVQAVELNADQLGLQRSDQLRELFESLGETNPDAKRPTASLSPEDLTDAEWYFLVCMSFLFNVGQGLPGKSFSKNQTFWLCNAHRADTKVFSRSLLAKSASIQTIVCFPHLGGVIELGSTELVPEDLNLIQHIKTSFLECPANKNVLITYEGLEHGNIPENGLDPLLDCPNVDICSPKNSSNDFADNLLRDELVEGVDCEAACQMQSWPLMDDAISNCLNNHSMNSSDCVSQTYENPVTIVPFSDTNKETNSCLLENQECNQHKNISGFQGNDDVHYQSVLSNLLKSSHQLILGPHFRNRNRESSFVCWKKDGISRPRSGAPQKLLKKVLFEVAKMHKNRRVEPVKESGNSRHEVDENDRNHVLSERKRREKINERFTILGSLIPSGGKVDKVSILDHTIDYLRELERKVQELESYKESTELGSMIKNKPQDAIERTSDNYGPNKVGKNKKALGNKRKACDMDKTGPVNTRAWLRDLSNDDITVGVIDKDVSIVLRCSSRDGVLIEVMEILSKLNMELQSVQSSNVDGILCMTIKATCKGLKAASGGAIRQALQKVVRKC